MDPIRVAKSARIQGAQQPTEQEPPAVSTSASPRSMASSGKCLTGSSGQWAIPVSALIRYEPNQPVHLQSATSWTSSPQSEQFRVDHSRGAGPDASGAFPMDRRSLSPGTAPVYTQIRKCTRIRRDELQVDSILACDAEVAHDMECLRQRAEHMQQQLV